MQNNMRPIKLYVDASIPSRPGQIVVHYFSYRHKLIIAVLNSPRASNKYKRFRTYLRLLAKLSRNRFELCGDAFPLLYNDLKEANLLKQT